MEPIIDATAAAGAPAADIIKDTSTTTFVQDVIEASREVPVIVDFWAPWCGPCKQLGPILEKAVTEARGAVRLVKLDIDRNPQIAQQLRIQSIPAVFAFFQGRPVDGFQGALPESQVKEFVGRLSEMGGGVARSPVEDALEQAKALLEAGEFAQAGALYGQILQHAPDSLPAKAGLARCSLETGNPAQAREIVESLTDEERQGAAVLPVVKALELAEKAAGAGDIAGLRAAVEAGPGDHQARYDLAVALYAAGEREAAIDELLTIVRRDRKWNDEAARKQLVDFFDAMGPADPLTAAGRRKLSSVLFS